MINKAIHFATVAHSNQTRKGTEIPYILHCLEAGTLAANLSMKNGKWIGYTQLDRFVKVIYT